MPSESKKKPLFSQIRLPALKSLHLQLVRSLVLELFISSLRLPEPKPVGSLLLFSSFGE
jgi:hypothetical protein